MTVLRLALTGFLILAFFAMPLSGRAQAARIYRVGVVLLGGPHSSTIDGLPDGLRELGFEEVSDLRRLRQLEDENSRLKRLISRGSHAG